MRNVLFATAIAVAVAFGIFSSPSIAPNSIDRDSGTVHFATSCNETAQRRFDRAMRYQHSFWYKASREIFEEALKADPECGIAYWGIALGLVDNPHFGPPAPNLPLGLAAIQAAKTRAPRPSANAIISTRWRCCMSIMTRRPARRAFSPTSRLWKRWPRATRTTMRRRSYMRLH